MVVGLRALLRHAQYIPRYVPTLGRYEVHLVDSSRLGEGMWPMAVGIAGILELWP